MSGRFTIGNGTRQGGVLSPYLFSRYIRGMLHSIAESHIGCYIWGLSANVLAYADDLVILAPSWKGPEALIDKLSLYAPSVDTSCNARKTVYGC